MARTKLRNKFICLCKTKRFQTFKDGQLKKQNGECYYCDQKFGPECHIEIDHITPLTRGGTNDIDNMVLSCQKCNLEKGSKLISEWLNPREIFYGN